MLGIFKIGVKGMRGLKWSRPGTLSIVFPGKLPEPKGRSAICAQCGRPPPFLKGARRGS